MRLYKEYTTNTYLYKQYGFVPNPSLPPWTSYKIHLGKTPVHLYLNQIYNQSFHNLCCHTSPPCNIGELLGLGLNFCVQKISIDKTQPHLLWIDFAEIPD